jgi:hypothetical protein
MVNPGYPNVIAVRSDTDDTPMDLEMAADTKSLKVALYVYNPASLSWERMRQPQIAPLADDLPMDTRMEYSAGNIIYKGIHATHKALTSNASWLIWKYTWTGDDLTRIEGPLEGSWDNRATLDWA